MKVTTTSHGSMLFSPNTQAGGEQIGGMVTYDVARGLPCAGTTMRATSPTQLARASRRPGTSTSRRSRSPPAAPGRAGETLVDDMTINDEVIDFE